MANVYSTNEAITEASLRELYPKVVHIWKKVGLFLGFRWAELRQFEHDYVTHEEVVFRMLLSWSRHTSPRDIKARLFETIRQAGQMLDEKHPVIPWESGDICDDKYLFQLCEYMVKKWEKVAAKLHIPKASLERWKSYYKPPNIVYSAMDVFVEWRDQRGTDYTDTFNRLVKTIEKVSDFNFIRALKRNARACKDLLIMPEHFSFCKENGKHNIVLGHGSNGIVLKAIYMAEEVAVKIFAQGYKLHLEKQNQLKAEAKTMQKASHSNTVPFKGIILDDNEMVYGLVMDFMTNGSLHEFIENQDDALDLSLKFRIVIDIARGMTFLHDKLNIVHQDLKSTNVLLDENLNARIGDFGHAGLSDAGSTSSFVEQKGGTMTYSAPEVLNKSGTESRPEKASDVWSYGIVMFFVCADKKRMDDERKNPYKRLPFQQGTSFIDIVKIVLLCQQTPVSNEQIKMKIFDNFPAVYIEVMVQCCAWKKEERPTFAAVLKNLTKFFEKNNYQRRASEEAEGYRIKRFARVLSTNVDPYGELKRTPEGREAMEEKGDIMQKRKACAPDSLAAKTKADELGLEYEEIDEALLSKQETSHNVNGIEDSYLQLESHFKDRLETYDTDDMYLKLLKCASAESTIQLNSCSAVSVTQNEKMQAKNPPAPHYKNMNFYGNDDVYDDCLNTKITSKVSEPRKCPVPAPRQLKHNSDTDLKQGCNN